MIQATNTLNDHQLLEAKALIAICQKYDGTFRDPYLSNMLNFDPDMPAFFLYYEKGELIGLLTVYADDPDVEVAILVHPNHRRQGIARALYRSFETETASYPIESVTFQTERVFLEKHPEFASNWGLVEDEGTETRLYILLKNGQVIGTCTVDLSSNTNYLYGLAIAELERGKGYGSYLAKSLVNQLIEQNDKEFQIAVEDSNVGAKRLYEKIGFVKQTQVVYLKPKE